MYYIKRLAPSRACLSRGVAVRAPCGSAFMPSWSFRPEAASTFEVHAELVTLAGGCLVALDAPIAALYY